jgi:hypothetical protein
VAAAAEQQQPPLEGQKQQDGLQLQAGTQAEAGSRGALRQPMRGQRQQPAAAPLGGSEQQVPAQQQRKQQEDVVKQEQLSSPAASQQQPRQQPALPQPSQPQQQQQQQQQHKQQQPAQAQAQAASATAAAAAKPKQRRQKKLPAFNPSEAEIDACFDQLAAASGSSSVITMHSIMEVSEGMDRWIAGWVGRLRKVVGQGAACLPPCLFQVLLNCCGPCRAALFPPQVGKALGQDLDAPAVQNMMTHAAAQVLGWGSGGGRHAGARLARDEFKRLMEHFRVV